MLMMLKQARAVYLDRLQRVVRGDSLCDVCRCTGIERNAYMLMYQDDACTVLMPGMLVPPFADERYSKESLYARIGFVIAHELMHATAVNQDQWDERYLKTLAARLLPQRAIVAYRGHRGRRGDGGAGARQRSRTTASLCAHVSQLLLRAHAGGSTAARLSASRARTRAGNVRGDAACAFFKEHFS